MQLIVGGRASGKTTALIRKSAETRFVIVCASHDLARHVERMARSMGLQIPAPTTYAALLGHHVQHAPGLLVDDLDTLLASLARGVPIAAATSTGEVIAP